MQAAISDVTRIPSEADNANRSSILDVAQSNSFAALEDMVDDAEAESSASVTYTCDKLTALEGTSTVNMPKEIMRST